MSTPELDPTRTAVLVMDMQAPFLAHCADAPGLISRINQLTGAARDAGALIGFVRVAFRPGHPEMADHSPLAAVVKPAGMLVEGGADTEIDSALDRAEADVVVTKHRTSALYGNDLDLILRARRVDTLVLTGFSTAGVILSTMDTAFELDYRIVVPADCCADPDSDLHRTLLTKLFPRKATVLAGGAPRWVRGA